MDEVRVNRIGDKMHPDCYGTPLLPDDVGELATFLRDSQALDTEYGESFNMSDVLRSSLRLDDLTPFYRAHLFAMMPKPITGANVAAIEMDITRRQDFGEIFEATYLHRSSACTTCHNSAWSTTDSADPALDHHWPITGLFEKSVYGASVGRPEMDVFSMFRHLNVVREKNGTRPWGLDGSCGRFNRPEDIPEDPAGYEAFFIIAQGPQGSVWDVEASLELGVNALRYDGIYINPISLEIDGHESFAYMLSARIVNRIWREIMGYPLTLVHYFPRNEFQRDILLELTNHFVGESWSLKTLLVDILTHPLYNESAPVDGCGPDHPYLMPRVFNPWSDVFPIEEEQGNSVGDQVHRHSARVMLSMIENALNWSTNAAYPKDADEAFQQSIGIFLKDGEPGFSGVDFQGMLAWENRHGACESQGTLVFEEGPFSCVGKCGDPGQEDDPCYCDSKCEEYGDCCPNYQTLCVDELEEAPSGGMDWINKLLQTANVAVPQEGKDPISVRDIASGLKDRLIAEPDITTWQEEALISALFEVTSLDTPIADLENLEERTRFLCGILLESPQFLLSGLPPPDQVTTPRLIVDGQTYQAHCDAWKSPLKTMSDYSMTCEENGLTVSLSPNATP
jgi:hypothetical protein